jgi:hypothetical protein
MMIDNLLNDGSFAQARAALAGFAAFLQLIGPLTRNIGGRLGVVLVGEGAWHVDLDAPGGRWGRGLPEGCDIEVYATPRALLALFFAPETLAADEIDVRGDRARLFVLAELAQRSRSPLALRVSAERMSL